MSVDMKPAGGVFAVVLAFVIGAASSSFVVLVVAVLSQPAARHF